MRIQSVRGTRDFYPEEMALRLWLFESWRRVSRRAGFVEVDGPALEPLDLYTGKSGPEIADQLYWLEDKSGRRLALRPEFTPTLARMIAARQASLREPIRWFNISRCFRYERAQKGRLREFFQWNVDLVGVEGEVADAECIAVAADALAELGLGPDDVEFRISDRRLLGALVRHLGIADAKVPQIFQILDKRDKVEAKALEAMLAEAGLAPDQRAALERILAWREFSDIAAGERATPEVAQAVESLERLFGLLKAYGIDSWCRFDIGTVRGLDYYTGPVWEVHDRKGELRAIFGGGRYDRLLADVGGKPMAACGFGCGDVILGMLLRDRGLGPELKEQPEYYIATWNRDWKRVFTVVSHLRRKGRAVLPDCRGGTILRQEKRAIESGARFIVTVDDKDIAWPLVRVRDLRPADSGGPTSAAKDYRDLGGEPE